MILDKLKLFFGSSTTVTPTALSVESLYSEPRSFYLNGVAKTSTSRNTIYLARHEIYEDAFVREMVKVIITRAIGATYDRGKHFTLTFNHKLETTEYDEDLRLLEKLINLDLVETAMDAQFYGDAYSYIQTEEGKGVTNIINNWATKPFNVVPIMSNKSNDPVRYEVPKSTTGTVKKSKETGGRLYVPPTAIARMNAKGNGYRSINMDIPNIENMNPFIDEERLYEDSIYGGVVEGAIDSYKMFAWSIDALAKTRISSAVKERFITQALQDTSPENRKLLKDSLESRLKAVRTKVLDMLTSKDGNILTANYLITTTGDNTNAINIEEFGGDYSGLTSIDDIMINIKKFIADIGFNIELTPFSDAQQGGFESGGATQKSIQMDAQGEQVRKSLVGYINQIIETHFRVKYGQIIDTSMVNIDFISAVNSNQLLADEQRMQSVSNDAQVWALIEQIKGMGLQDKESTRSMLRSQFSEIVNDSIDEKEETILAMVDIVFEKAEADETDSQEAE